MHIWIAGGGFDTYTINMIYQKELVNGTLISADYRDIGITEISLRITLLSDRPWYTLHGQRLTFKTGLSLSLT